MRPKASVQDALEKLLHRDGALVPAAVVEAARDPNSPLHDRFEWDDSRAGEAHRIDQARRLIREVRVVTIVNDAPVRTITYTKDPDRREAGYMRVASIVPRSEVARNTVLQEFDRAISSLERASEFAGMLGIGGDVQQILEDMIALRTRTQDMKLSTGKRRA